MLDRFRRALFGSPKPSHLQVEVLGVRSWIDESQGEDVMTRAWGFVNEPLATRASYSVEWPHRAFGERVARFDLIIGKWGEGANPEDRQMCSALYRIGATGNGEFMVIDGDLPPVSGLATRALSREEVIGTPIQEHVFALLDVVLLTDPNVQPVRDWNKQKPTL